ncbi:MAG: hypothetical protein HW419_773 [Deltaproteobacteria bacterium]|nr:hypothetical protein [Deltaproteobacteria bacterium]
MSGKPEILRALEGLPQDSLREIKKFIDSLKQSNGKGHATGRNVELVAKKQISAIKKWAGRTLKEGFSGREHDAVLYRKHS